MQYKTELIWYIHVPTELPATPHFHKSHRKLLEKWFLQNSIEPKRLELMEQSWKMGLKNNDRDDYINGNLKQFVEQYKIVKVLSEDEK